jgi:PAS domain S-box-containing protein
MPNTATVREQRLRKTKAQLIDEIDTLEQRATLTEAAYKSDRPIGAKAGDRYLANQEIADLARFTSENPNPVLRAMPDGTVLYANDAAIAVNGLLKGRKKSTLAGDLAGVCAKASRSAEVRESEFESGDHIFAFSIAPIADETYINIYGRDVTDAHNTRLALEAANEVSVAAEARLKSIIDNSPATICLKDAKGRYLLVNKHFAELHGTTAGAMLGKTAHELFPKEIADPFRTHDRRVLRTGVAEEREQVVTTPGGLRTFSEIKFPITANGEQSTANAIGLIATDITGRKQAEQAAAEAQALLTDAIENISEGFVLYDADGRLALCNSTCKDFYDYADAEVAPGVHFEDLVRLDIEKGTVKSLGDGEEDHFRARAAERGHSRTSFDLQLSDGRWLNIRDRKTAAGGYVSTQTDITERKRAEEALREQTLIVELLHKTAADANQAENAEAAMRACLEAVCAHTGWPAGHIYVRSPEVPDLLVPTDIWHLDQPERFATFRKVTQKTTFEPGVGLPGRALESGKPAWIVDVTTDPNFPRAKLAEEIGVRAGFAVPVLVGNRVEAVLEFFAATAVEPDEALLQVLGNIGAQVGRAVERKRAEAELAEKEAQLRLALDNMPGGIRYVDKDRRYILFNSQYSEMYEFPEGLLKVGESMRVEGIYQAKRGDYGPVDPETEADEWLSDMSDQTGPTARETTVAGGKILQIYTSPLGDGGVVKIVTDITERRRAEQELAEKEAQLRVALDNMPGGIRLIDGNRNFVLSNQQYIDLFEYPEGLLKVGDSIRVENLYCAQRGDFGPGDPETLVDEWLADAPEQTERSRWEFTLEGGKVLQVRTSPLPDRGVVNVVTDITEGKRAENALLEAKQRTEEASKLVAEKNRMLESLSSKLSKYLSPQVYASIFSGEQSVEIASKRKKLTVFFSDIAGFTGISDSLESEELTNLLNHYLTEMSKIALDYGATIDKYVGDAIIAFFGDPETRGVKEDARACVNMAIAMQRRLRELQSEWLDMGLERPFQVRIGINTGFCTVGNFGSEDRMDYTIIGNEVNLAARLESHAEVGGIIMAHETHSLVKATVLAEEGDTLTVKGFAKPVRTYSVVGLYDDLVEQGRIIRRDQDGLALVIDRNKLTKKGKAEAIKALEEAAAQLKG